MVIRKSLEKCLFKLLNLYRCWSFIGMMGGRQTISLQPSNCIFKGSAMHELMHALGFYHEHTRTDRDKYIKIHWENINECK